MDAKHDETVAKARKALAERVPADWDGEWNDQVRGSFRYFAEEVLGASVARLLPCMEALKASPELAGGAARVVLAGKDEWLQVQAPDGVWHGFRWSGRDARKDGDSVTDVTVARVDAARPDYPYPERIGFATVMDLDGRAAARGSCELGRFGAYLDALSAMSGAAGFVAGPDVGADDGLMRYSQWEELLRLDGGVAGEACREAADGIAQVAADRIMRWAAGTLPGVIEGLRAEDCVWGRRMLRYNDLDNNVVLVEEGSRQAVFHRNGSYISEFRTYVLVRDGDSLSLHALEDGTDAFSVAMSAFRAGGEVPFAVASIIGGEVVRAAPFDETDVLDAMAHGLKFTAEILGGERADADYNERFACMDTRLEDDEFEDDVQDGPAP